MRETEEFKFAMAFGVGFITVLFMGFLTGFMIGQYILAWSKNDSLILSLFTGVATLFMEGFLMMCRLHKWEQKRMTDKKIYKVE